MLRIRTKHHRHTSQQHEGEEQPETDAQQKATGLQGSGHPADTGRTDTGAPILTPIGTNFR